VLKGGKIVFMLPKEMLCICDADFKLMHKKATAVLWRRNWYLRNTRSDDAAESRNYYETEPVEREKHSLGQSWRIAVPMGSSGVCDLRM
jgi:hypothetical protein